MGGLWTQEKAVSIKKGAGSGEWIFEWATEDEFIRNIIYREAPIVKFKRQVVVPATPCDCTIFTLEPNSRELTELQSLCKLKHSRRYGCTCTCWEPMNEEQSALCRRMCRRHGPFTKTVEEFATSPLELAKGMTREQ